MRTQCLLTTAVQGTKPLPTHFGMHQLISRALNELRGIGRSKTYQLPEMQCSVTLRILFNQKLSFICTRSARLRMKMC